MLSKNKQFRYKSFLKRINFFFLKWRDELQKIEWKSWDRKIEKNKEQRGNNHK